MFFKKLGGALEDHLATTRSLDLWKNETLGLRSEIEESGDEFRKRCAAAAEERIKAASAKLEASTEKALATLETRIKREQAELERDREKVASRKREATVSLLGKVAGVLLSIFGGRKRDGFRRAGAAIHAVSSKREVMERAALSVKESEDEIARLRGEQERLREKLREDLEKLRGEWEEKAGRVEPLRVLPARSSIQVQESGILWRLERAEPGSAGAP
jgi:hypothetical protein